MALRNANPKGKRARALAAFNALTKAAPRGPVLLPCGRGSAGPLGPAPGAVQAVRPKGGELFLSGSGRALLSFGGMPEQRFLSKGKGLYKKGTAGLRQGTAPGHSVGSVQGTDDTVDALDQLEDEPE